MQVRFLKILAIGLLFNGVVYAQSQPQAQVQAQPQVQTQPQAPVQHHVQAQPQTQSLGDIARAYREKQAAEGASGVKPMVITNKDFPAQDPAALAAEREAQQAQHRMALNNAPDYRGQQQRGVDERAGEQWRGRIEEQKYRVSSLQARIDQIHAQIRSTSGTVQYDQPNSRYAARAQERVAEMEQQLDEQRRKLESMQEQARRAGMHTSVYDP